MICISTIGELIVVTTSRPDSRSPTNGAGVEAEQVAETKIVPQKGSALRWLLSFLLPSLWQPYNLSR